MNVSAFIVSKKKTKTENAYNKELQSGLCKVLVLFDKIRDQNLEVNLLKLYFKMLLSWKKNTKHETKEYHKDAIKKQMIFRIIRRSH